MHFRTCRICSQNTLCCKRPDLLHACTTANVTLARGKTGIAHRPPPLFKPLLHLSTTCLGRKVTLKRTFVAFWFCEKKKHNLLWTWCLSEYSEANWILHQIVISWLTPAVEKLRLFWIAWIIRHLFSLSFDVSELLYALNAIPGRAKEGYPMAESHTRLLYAQLPVDPSYLIQDIQEE